MRHDSYIMKAKKKNKHTRAQRKELRLGMASAWDIIRDAYLNYNGNNDVNQAAAIAFYAILSLIPLLLLTLLTAGYIFSSNLQIQSEIAESIRTIHPFFSEDLLHNLLSLKEKNRLIGGIGSVSLIWLSAMIFGALEKALDMIFRARTHRNLIQSKLLAIAMIPLGWLVAIISVGVSYVVAVIQKQTMISNSAIISQGYTFVSRYLLPYLLTILFVALLYRIVSKARLSSRGVLGGALIFATLLQAARFFFAWYTAHFSHYDIIFGTMEAVVMLVIWVFYMAIMLLFCAELISSYERRDLILLEEAFLASKKKALKTDERLYSKFGRLYSPGAYLFREGEGGNEMFYILDGQVRIEKKAGQVAKELALLGKGSYLGEMAALINAPRTASAVALTESHIAVVDGSIFRNVLRESEAVSLYMLKEFSHRIKHTNDDLERVTHAWIKLLIVFYFLKEWPLQEGRDPRSELALITDRTPGEIDEMFSWLTAEGILAMQKGRVIDFTKERAWELLKHHGK